MLKLNASIAIENTRDFNILLPIAMLEIKSDHDLDKFIHLINSEKTFDFKINTLGPKSFAKYSIN